MSTANRSKYAREFEKADTDRSGKISKAELRVVLDSLGKDMVDENRVFDKYDADKSGCISKSEFLTFMEDVDNAWIRVQKKTFSRWANTVLSNRLLSLEDITEDLRDGVLLKPLIELLAKKTLPKINKSPRMRLQKMENLNKSLDFLKSDGVKLVNIGADDITDGNERITLGLIWMLILKYQIGDACEQGSPKWLLLQWVKQQIAPYHTGVKLKNFKKGWSDGKVLSALTDSLGDDFKGLIDTDNISTDPYDASGHAMETALQNFDIPRIIDAADIVEEPDEHSIMTYVSYFRDWADKNKTMACAQTTTASGPGVEGGNTGPSTEFYVQTCNKQGEPLTTGGNGVAADITGPDGNKVPCKMKDNGDGTYTGQYPVPNPGDYIVDVRLRNEPIQGSEFTAHMEQGNPGACYAEGEGLHAGYAGKPCEFAIFSVDKDGNRVCQGGDPFDITITGPNGQQDFDLRDCGDGTYPCCYTPEATGAYTIDIKLMGQPIDDSPWTAQIDMWSTAENTVAYGPGVEGGDVNAPAEFTVETRDGDGKRIPMGGDDVAVTVTDPDGNKVPAKLRDNDDGTYSGSYPVEKPGDYVVDIRLRDDPIKDSAFTVRMENGCPGNCYADGEGLERGKTGMPAEFVIHSVDSNNRPVKNGGDPFVVDIAGPDGPLECEMQDQDDGTYLCSYLPQAEGDYQIDITLHGEPIKDAPFTSSIKRAPNAANSWVDGPGLERAYDNKPTFFTVHAMDDNKQPVAGDDCAVSIVPRNAGDGLNDIPVTITDNDDGTYTCAYTADEPGQYVINVQLDGDDVKDTPAPLAVLSAANTIAHGPGVEGGPCVGGPAEFTVETRDGAGNPVPCDGADVTVNVTDPDGNTVPADLKDNGDGTFTGSYPVDGPGDYVVDVRLADEPIKDSEFTVRMEKGCPGKCYAEGDGLVKGKTNKPAEFTIFSVAGDGQRITSGGDPFVVHIDGPGGEQDCEIRDLQDGSYHCQYIPTQEGKYHIDVTLLGEQIDQSPFCANIKRAPNASKSWVDGPGLKRAYDNKPTYLTVHAVGDDGEPVAGDDCNVAIIAEPGQDVDDIPVEVIDNGDGTYTCNYAPEDAGKFMIHAQLDGDDVKGTPCPLKVRVGADASKTNSAKFLVTIVAVDKRGNAKTEGGDDWEVTITGEDGDDVPVKTKDKGDGTYSAEYKLAADKSGGQKEYEVSMKLGGEPIGASPFKQYM